MTKENKEQTGETALDITWTWLRKGNIERKSIIFLNNAIRTNYIKAKINDPQKNKQLSVVCATEIKRLMTSESS